MDSEESIPPAYLAWRAGTTNSSGRFRQSLYLQTFKEPRIQFGGIHSASLFSRVGGCDE